MWSKNQGNTSSYENICFEKDIAIILIDDLLKSSTQKFYLGGIKFGIKFPSYNDETFGQWKFCNGI